MGHFAHSIRTEVHLEMKFRTHCPVGRRSGQDAPKPAGELRKPCDSPATCLMKGCGLWSLFKNGS
jgi:hypothetical protein